MKKAIKKKTVSAKAKTKDQKIPKVIKSNGLFIAGIGSSAGGLEALKSFFENTPSTTGIAFVIIQHLDPTHKSLLTELLSDHTKMKVLEAENGAKVQANCVYVIPPNNELKISTGILKLSKPSKERAFRRPIDTFFHSLAEDQGDKAIGIILSGTGTEGTLGLREIKAAGGISIVQDPKTAKFTGMPESAITSKIADYILAPEKMAMQLQRYIKKRGHSAIDSMPELTNSFDLQLKKIFSLVRSQTGTDFSNYKINTILRRISKRIALNQIDSIHDYVDFLQDNPLEIDHLYKDFLIGVTSFFRDKSVFENLENKAIPHLLKICRNKQELRLWVCGCSTGEEAYSLAILLKEAIEKSKQYMKITIFASDIDKESIEFARIGIYSDNILPYVSAERLSRNFIKKENGYQLKKEIREMIVFAHHNVIKDPPFSKMDMITCRNLLIYMNSELQKKIISIFHYSLINEGILLLGTSESLGEYEDMFTEFDPKNKIFKKKKDSQVRKPITDYEQPFNSHRALLPTKTKISNSKKNSNLSGLTEKILLDDYAPPSVVIDKNNDALYFSGNTGMFLEPPSGEARLNILEMARKGMKHALEIAIRESRRIKKEVTSKGIEVKVNDHFATINLIIRPVQIKDVDQGTLIIIFETAAKTKKPLSKKVANKPEKHNIKATELEKELKITREHLQIAINELETSNEDLQTTNEEYQSSNEELQSTNEELETSREELQSVNEELVTVNSELQNKIEQLSQANDDLNNLLRSIEVATVFLDRNMKIKRFTPTATKIFNLIPSDIDRPVTHLSSNLVYKALVDDVKNALKTLAVKSADVQATDGTWYQMRIIPYRTAENIIEGVLVTFVEITDQKNVEEKLKKTNEHLNMIMEKLPAVPFICTSEPDTKITFVGKSCEKVTGFLPEQFTKSINFWINRIHENDKKKIVSAFKNITKEGSLEIPFRWKCADGKYKQFINFIRYAKPENNQPAYIVGVWQDNTMNNKQLIEKNARKK